jgi:hypothetical protein
VQRQTLPEIASTISSRVGSGLRASRASVVRIMPDVQNPHWVAKSSRNAAWTSSSSPSGDATPSSVLTFAPATVSTATRQLSVGRPSSSTVHEPQLPVPQPRLAR